jgi:hypothetical protein
MICVMRARVIPQTPQFRIIVNPAFSQDPSRGAQLSPSAAESSSEIWHRRSHQRLPPGHLE